MFKSHIPLALSTGLVSGSILMIWFLAFFANGAVPELAFGFALTFLFAMSFGVLVHHIGYRSGLKEGRENGGLLHVTELAENSYYILHSERTKESGVRALFLTVYDPTYQNNFAFYKVRFDRFRDRDWRISADGKTFDRIDPLEETVRDREHFGSPHEMDKTLS